MCSCEQRVLGVQYGRLIEPFRIGMHHKGLAGKKKSLFEKFILFGMFPYPARLKWALMPMRILKTGLDKLIDKLQITRLLPVTTSDA
ncbi:MAG: hypothetical protein R3C11_05695 [Planctomycetaceae bacterium]